MAKRPWHYQSVKSAIQMFIDEHEPQAFISKSIEEEVAKNYHILTVGTEFGNPNRQQRQRYMTGVIIQATPAAVRNWYVRKADPILPLAFNLGATWNAIVSSLRFSTNLKCVTNILRHSLV